MASIWFWLVVLLVALAGVALAWAKTRPWEQRKRPDD